MEALLLQYGYVLLFAGVMVEGEAFLLAASLLARRGDFHLPIVIAVAVAANALVDQIYYVAARARGRAWLEQRFGGHPRYPRLVELMTRHGRWLLLVSRFAYGFRILIPAACGVLGMPALTFGLINLLAGIIWAIPVALVGYYGIGAAEALLGDVHRYEVWIATGLLLAVPAYVGARHVRSLVRRRDLRIADLHRLVPFVMGLMGVLNLASAILPRSPAAVTQLEQWLPLEVMQRSRPLMLFAGLALLQVTRSLARRKALGFWVAAGALSVSLVSHIGRAFDLQHSLVAGLLLAYLVYYRRRFNARSDPASLRMGLLMLPILGAAVVAYGYVGLGNLRQELAWPPGASPLTEAFRSGILVAEPQVDPLTNHAARFLGSLQIAGWIARLYLLVLFLRPVILRQRMEAPPEDVARIFTALGRHSLAPFTVQEDKHHLLTAGGRALVGYAVRGSVALACGDPIAAEQDLEPALRDYVAHCRENGWTPCVYEAAEENLPVYRGLGLRSLKIAEEALLDLPAFSLAGGKRAALRSMVHKVAKMGHSVARYDRASARDDATDEELEAISQEWLEEKQLGELGFTMGQFSLEALDGLRVFVCRSPERVEAFCSWLSYRGGQAAVIDLMRKRRDAVSGTMDLLLAESLSSLRDEGLLVGSLANAPLANVGQPRGSLERGVALVFEKMNAFYGYKNLFQFKKKFAPRWEGRYLVYPSGADLPSVAYAMASVHGSGGLLQLLLRR